MNRTFGIPNPITGTFRECLDHYKVASNSIVDGNEKIERRRLGEFLGPKQYENVRRWLGNNPRAEPAGDNLLMTRFYFELIGYEVAEVKNLPQVVYNIAKAIAFKVCSVDDVATRIGTSKHVIFPVLLGKTGMSDGRAQIMAELFKEHEEQLHLVEQNWRNKIGNLAKVKPDIVLSTTPVASQPKLLSISAPSGSILTQKAVINILASLVNAALPLADYMVSDNCTEEEREQLRVLTKGEGVFKLSNRLNRLCGPRALRDIPAVQ